MAEQTPTDPCRPVFGVKTGASQLKLKFSSSLVAIPSLIGIAGIPFPVIYRGHRGRDNFRMGLYSAC
jgi:hypothetical protein